MALLDTVLALVFVYLLASLLASALSELVEAVLRRRAKELWWGVSKMLNDPALVTQVYGHPLIKSLYKGNYTEALKDGQPTRKLPSYVPAASFAIALTQQVFDEAKDVDGLRAKLKANPEAPLSKLLSQFLDDTIDSLEALRHRIERWYDSTMDVVATWFKAHVQQVLLLVGLGMAIALNVNTIKIARELATNTAARNAVVAAATEFAKNNPAPPAQPPTGTTSDAKQTIQTLTAELQALPLPIGWSSIPDVRRALSRQGLLALLGWFLTACAVSLGAPFWFDLLNKIVSLRSAVKLPGLREKEAMGIVSTR
jgi:hypothetical protein